MTNHTGTVCACQDHAHNSRPESTPLPSSTTPDSIDRRLVQRYGLALLTGGYTALPTYAWVYYARLGVTEAEMVLIAQLCTYWWSSRDPYPGEAALAARMGKSVRTIQGYLRSLEGKGLLHIHTRLSTNGRQSTNAYDLRPFFAAVEGLARVDGLLPADVDDAPTTTATTNRDHQPHSAGDNDACNGGPCDHKEKPDQHAERKSLCAERERTGPAHTATDGAAAGPCRGEACGGGRVKNPAPQVNPIEIDTFDFDSIPPTPTNATVTTTAHESHAQPDDAMGDEALAAEIAALSDEFGDDAPRSSLGRARNLCRDAGVSLDRFLRLLDEAVARTRDRQASIVKRRRDGQTPNGMPYLFAVLADLLHPAPPQRATVGPDGRRVDQPGHRRRRRADSCGAVSGSYAAWSDSPMPLPIVEEHPVWRAVLDELAQVMTSENFNAWFATTRAVGGGSGLLRVAVADAFHQQWLDRRLRGAIEQALARVADGVRIEFVVAAAA